MKIGNEHIAFACEEIMSLADIKDSWDPKGVLVMHYLTQDLKCFDMSLINLHFKIKPIPS
jgi:Mago nashi protein